VTAPDIGLGARAALGAPGGRPSLGPPVFGRVVAVYRAAAYLRFPAGLCALTAANAPPGPLHVRSRVLPPCRLGERVRFADGVLAGQRWALSLPERTWVGALPAAPALDVGWLVALATRVGGRGPGLTPAGDDVLAGALLVAAAGGTSGLADIAAAVRTTEIASAFLRWAALGQCVAPAHRALTELAGGLRVGPGAAGLAGLGASSGRALLRGLRIGWAAASPSTALSTIVNAHPSS